MPTQSHIGGSGRMLAVALLLIGAASTPAVAGEMVEFKNPMGTSTKGYLALPEGDAKAPAILVIQEWWGLTDWIKENADRMADLGYVALAVDLYDGKATDDPGEAHELMRALDPSEGVGHLKGAIEYLQTLDRVDQDRKIAAVGWCMGGMYSRMIAQQSDAIGPTIICYGSVSIEPDQIDALAGRPVLGIFGAQDRGIPADRVRQVFDALKKAGSTVDLHLYDSAGHAFMRPGGNQYVEDAADDAWKQITTFLAEHLLAEG
ncbi:dienelactone hydrolase family protein [Tautonia rosea]|uniref:dienelactone hydrolase family protein n=1 Tax=Tautonia rosea TaxID=2728037 RepID=UPI001473E96D|nr:dienelactone hydrolase family protein [Tautonia rosea]